MKVDARSRQPITAHWFGWMDDSASSSILRIVREYRDDANRKRTRRICLDSDDIDILIVALERHGYKVTKPCTTSSQ